MSLYARDRFDSPAPPSWIEGVVGRCTGAGTLIAVLDSGWKGCDRDPRVRSGVALVGSEFDLSLRPSTDDLDRTGHGTACADLVLQAAPGATLLPIRVFGTRLETSLRVLLEGLSVARKAGARVINMSLATTRKEFAAPLRRACNDASADGIIIVAAKHNFASVSYPSDFECVIGAMVTPSAGEFSLLVRPNSRTDCELRRPAPLVRTLARERIRLDSNSLAAATVTGIVARIVECYPASDLKQVRMHLAHMAALSAGLPGRWQGTGSRLPEDSTSSSEDREAADPGMLRELPDRA